MKPDKYHNYVISWTIGRARVLFYVHADTPDLAVARLGHANVPWSLWRRVLSWTPQVDWQLIGSCVLPDDAHLQVEMRTKPERGLIRAKVDLIRAVRVEFTPRGLAEIQQGIETIGGDSGYPYGNGTVVAATTRKGLEVEYERRRIPPHALD